MDDQVVTRQRQTLDSYFGLIARQVATRATCDRKHVGAVIVRDGFILSTGYNGSIRGMPHCDDVGHMMSNSHCIRTVHAEANAIAQAALNGHRTKDSTIYVTALPCFDCFKLLINAGIIRIMFEEKYRPERWNDYMEVCDTLGIKLEQHELRFPEECKDLIERALGA